MIVVAPPFELDAGVGVPLTVNRPNFESRASRAATRCSAFETSIFASCVLWSVPGATTVAVNGALQPALTLSAVAALYEKHAVPLTASPSTSVPEEIELPLFEVSAWKFANVPPTPK